LLKNNFGTKYPIGEYSHQGDIATIVRNSNCLKIPIIKLHKLLFVMTKVSTINHNIHGIGSFFQGFIDHERARIFTVFYKVIANNGNLSEF
jgi:hypothetical protein